MNKEKKTKISNMILYRLMSSYSIPQVRFFLLSLGKAIGKSYKLIETVEIDEDELLIEQLDNYGAFDVNVQLDETKSCYKKRMTTKGIVGAINELTNIKLNYMEVIDGQRVYKTIMPYSSIEYNEFTQKFKVEFNSNYADLLILVKNRYSIINISDIERIKNKYEFMVYSIYTSNQKIGKNMIGIDDLKEYLIVTGSNNDMLKYFKKAVERFNAEFGVNVKMKNVKIEKKIIAVEFSW